jgi:hypothetical protein
LLTILSGKTRPVHVDHGSGRTQHAGICSGFDRPIALRQVTIAIELIRLGASDLSRGFIHSPTEAGERSRTGAARNAGDNQRIARPSSAISRSTTYHPIPYSILWAKREFSWDGNSGPYLQPMVK